MNGAAGWTVHTEAGFAVRSDFLGVIEWACDRPQLTGRVAIETPAGVEVAVDPDHVVKGDVPGTLSNLVANDVTLLRALADAERALAPRGAVEKLFTITFDGEGDPIASTWREIFDANHEDTALIEAIDALAVGEEHHAGGGAAPLVTTRRIR